MRDTNCPIVIHQFQMVRTLALSIVFYFFDRHDPYLFHVFRIRNCKFKPVQLQLII
jgi:hypothetical protein